MATAASSKLDDRADAGRRLGERLERYRASSPIVLGIPRGGVAVAFEIARHLGAELDVLLVRKVGTPGDPEYGLGAVAEGGVLVLDEARARGMGYSRAALAPVIDQERAEVEARVARFRGRRPSPALADRTVILVDDGVATGGTVEAAVAVVRAHRPRAVVLALGVAPPDVLPRLRASADAVEVALVPYFLEAVGQWYRAFAPVEDAEVVRLLAAARAWVPPRPPAASVPE